MKILLALLFLVFLSPVVTMAEQLQTDYFTIDMPDSWQRLQEDNSNSISISVYSTKNRDTIVTTVIGSSGGADLLSITKSFAQQYKASSKTSVKNNLGVFYFTSYNGQDSSGYVTLQDTTYMVVTVSGNLRKARSFMKNFKSNDYAALIPTF